MSKELTGNLVIIPKPDYISWEEITQLLHVGYAERVEEGLHYSATDQTVQKTIERVGDGVCLVALLNGKLVGTISYRLISTIDNKDKKWFHDDLYLHPKQFAVHPEYKRMGIGKKIWQKLDEIAFENNVGSIITDTSEKAIWLGRWNESAGRLKVGYVSFPSTNYYSIIRRKPIKGKKYDTTYRTVRYQLSKCICRIIRKEDGAFTFLGKSLSTIVANIR